LGYRLEGFSVRAVYRPPDEATQKAFAAIMEKAREAMALDEPEEIKKQLQPVASIVTQDERNFESVSLHLEMLGRLMTWEGVQGVYPAEYDQVLQLANQIAEKKKENEQAVDWDQINRAKAWRSLAAGEYANTMSTLEGALKSDHAQNWALLGELAHRSGAEARAKEFFGRLKDQKLRRGVYFKALHEGDVKSIKALAAKSYLPAEVEMAVNAPTKDESIRESIARLDKVLEKTKAYSWLAVKVRASKGDLYAKEENEERAQKEWQEIVKKNPNEAAVWFKLAKSYEREAKWDESIKAYQSSLKAGGMQKNVSLRFIRLLRTRLKVVDALEQIEKALKAHPKSPRIYYEKGETERILNQFDSAKASFNKALELDPHFEPATLSLASIARESQNWSEAEKLLKKIPESSKNYSMALLGLGELAYSQQELDDASKKFALAIKVDSKNIPAYDGLVRLLIRKEQDAKALALAEKGLSESPKSPELHMMKAQALRSQDKLDEA